MISTGQTATDFGAPSRTARTLIAAQGREQTIIINNIVVSVPVGNSGIFQFYAGSNPFFMPINLSSPTEAIFSTGPMKLKLPANTALKYDSSVSSSGDMYVNWEVIG